MTLPRLLLLAAIAAGVSYMAGWGLPLSPAVSTAWKGAGVGLLALYAASRAKSLDGWLLTAVMALGATGDVLLETSGLTVGALAFLAGHLTAVGLYLRNRRLKLHRGDWRFAIWVAPTIVATAFFLPADRSSAPSVALYAFGLAAMAVTAWLSRFDRRRVGLGAFMFAYSDLLIFARAGPLHGQIWVNDAIWILYFAGQTLICVGVSEGEAKSAQAKPVIP